MVWAIASSILVIYLYRTLNAQSAPAPGGSAADTVEAELDALNARIAALESELDAPRAGSAKP